MFMLELLRKALAAALTMLLTAIAPGAAHHAAEVFDRWIAIGATATRMTSRNPTTTANPRTALEPRGCK